MSCIDAAVPPPGGSFAIWEGWGTSLAWFANVVGHHQALNQHICQLLFHPSLGLGLNIVRYNIGGGNVQEHLEQFRVGGCVPCHRSAPGSPLDPAADAAQTLVLTTARDLGADNFEAFANSPPFYLTASGNSRGHARPLCNNLPLHQAAAFARHLVDVVQHMQERHSLTFTSVSPFNEPFSPAWTLQMSAQEGCFMTSGCMAAVLRALHAELDARCITPRPLVTAFEEFCLADTYLRHLCPLLPTPTHRLWSRGLVGRLHTHTYTSRLFLAHPPPFLPLLQDNSLWRALTVAALQRQRHRQASSQLAAASAASCASNHHHQHGGLQLWVSEYGSGKGASDLAQRIMGDLLTLVPSGWVYWQAVEDTGATWGLLTAPLTEAAAAVGIWRQATATAGSAGGGQQHMAMQQELAEGPRPTAAAAAAAAAVPGSAAPSPAAAEQVTSAVPAAAAVPPPSQPAAAAAAAAAAAVGQVGQWCDQVVIQPAYHVMALFTAAIRPGAAVWALPTGRHWSKPWRRSLAGVDQHAQVLSGGLQGVGAWHAARRELVYVVSSSSKQQQVLEVLVRPSELLLAGLDGGQEQGVARGRIQVVVRVLDTALVGRGGSCCKQGWDGVEVGSADSSGHGDSSRDGHQSSPAAVPAGVGSADRGTPAVGVPAGHGGGGVGGHPSAGVWRQDRYLLLPQNGPASVACVHGRGTTGSPPAAAPHEYVVQVWLPPLGLTSVSIQCAV